MCECKSNVTVEEVYITLGNEQLSTPYTLIGDQYERGTVKTEVIDINIQNYSSRKLIINNSRIIAGDSVTGYTGNAGNGYRFLLNYSLNWEAGAVNDGDKVIITLLVKRVWP